MAPHTTATAVCYVLALGPAALSAWSRNRREQRERQSMRRLLDLEACDFKTVEQRPARRRGELFGCLGFGAVVLGLLATLLFWDEVPPAALTRAAGHARPSPPRAARPRALTH